MSIRPVGLLDGWPASPLPGSLLPSLSVDQMLRRALVAPSSPPSQPGVAAEYRCPGVAAMGSIVHLPSGYDGIRHGYVLLVWTGLFCLVLFGS